MVVGALRPEASGAAVLRTAVDAASLGLPPGSEAAFASLRQRFLQALPARQQALLDATSASQRGDLLHRLAGAAGSYGLQALGSKARAAEQAENAAGPDTAEACAARAAAWAALHAEFNALCTNAPQSRVSDTVS